MLFNYSDMPPVDILRILCIKIGKYQSTSKLRFVRKFVLKRKTFRLMNAFLNLDIFVQSETLSSMLISLFSKNKEMMTNQLSNILRVTEISIEIDFDGNHYCYIPSSARFEVDATISEGHSVKFSYIKDVKPTSDIAEVWGVLLPDIESAYMKIIYCVADILNNPSINKELTINEIVSDPFIND